MQWSADPWSFYWAPRLFWPLEIDTATGPGLKTRYLVPIGAAVTPVASDATASASGLTYSRTYSAQLIGHTIAANELVSIAAGWVSEIDITFTGIRTRSFALRATTASPIQIPAGSALWILPMLMPPDAGVSITGPTGTHAASGPMPRVLSLGHPEGRAAATPMLDGTISMLTGIYAYDNPDFNIKVWESHFTVTGTVVNGAFTNFVGDMRPQADSPFLNWSCDGWNAYFALATSTEGDGVGQGYFSGWFPYSSDAFWWTATSTHYNYLRLSDQTVTLQVEVDAAPVVGSSYVWKQRTLVDHAVFPDDGTEHDGSFYIVPQSY